ncbi:MAG TPA: hypothetical protein DC058_01210 [Planctomycetaceae bacterium]|nr:hypothetical protein [Planctomycetaceae bacterium]HBC59820.1 hypothetical protein [Planctomycetaceae bacterium]
MVDSADECERAVVVLYSTDLMLLSSVSGAAEQLGLGFCNLRSLSETVGVADQAGVILCVDLASNVDVWQISANCGADVLRRAIAFGPHVHVQRLEAARAVGFGLVVSRGQFVMQLRQLLLERAGKDSE